MLPELPPDAWYVMRTRSNFEIKARQYLDANGIRCYLPSFLRASRRKRECGELVEQPAFAGYLFVDAMAYRERRVDVKRTPGFMALIKRGGQPAPVEARVVVSLRIILTDGERPAVYPYLKPGQQVRVISGALAGAEGVVAAPVGRRKQLIVNIGLLGRSVGVALGPGDVENI